MCNLKMTGSRSRGLNIFLQARNRASEPRSILSTSSIFYHQRQLSVILITIITKYYRTQLSILLIPVLISSFITTYQYCQSQVSPVPLITSVSIIDYNYQITIIDTTNHNTTSIHIIP